jgi:CheY-like chemotaxis protein
MAAAPAKKRQKNVKANRMVLVVDDDEQVLFVWDHALSMSDLDCCVETARNGHEGLQRFRRRAFDLVVTDLRMPEMDGYQLTEAIRCLDHNIPIIWITAFPHPDTEAQARQLAVRCCLYKPLPIATIREAVRDALTCR